MFTMPPILLFNYETRWGDSRSMLSSQLVLGMHSVYIDIFCRPFPGPERPMNLTSTIIVIQDSWYALAVLSDLDNPSTSWCCVL
jgi:hypothetical protein